MKFETPGLRPEHELLLQCARVELSSAHRERIAALLEQPLSWELLHRRANLHGLTSLVYRHLGSMASAACPASLWRTWGQQSLGILANNLRLVAELSSLGKLFRESSIPFLCLKGPALTGLIYGDLRLRPSCDLDLLVRPADARRACELFVRRGFVAQFELAGQCWETFLQIRSELTFRRENPCGLAELHWGLLSPGYSFTPSVEACWDRAESVCVESASVLTLGLEDNLLFLCLHASKHDWQRLIWLVDLAELLRQRAGVDWDRVLTPANVRSAGRQIQVSLLLASRLLEAPVPPDVWRRLPPDGQAERIVQRVHRDQLFARHPDRNSVHTPPWRKLHFQAMRSRRDRFRYVYEVLLQPTPVEWQLWPLPSWLAPAYHVLRPIRLLWRQLLRWLRIPRTGRA